LTIAWFDGNMIPSESTELSISKASSGSDPDDDTNEDNQND